MIRCRVTPKISDNGIHVLLEWVEVAEGEIITGVVATEEFDVSAHRQGCAYVTRGGFNEMTMIPGTFWIDEDQRRHFIMQAEPGAVGATGQEMSI